jgi:ferredoxin-NADP reductase
MVVTTMWLLSPWILTNYGTLPNRPLVPLPFSENLIIIDAGMATQEARNPLRDHGFHPLRVKAVVRETADAASFVLDVPADLEDSFSYEAGQFCNFSVQIGGERFIRCYSMSSSPDVDPELQVTVKRVPGGVVSNWMIDCLAAGDLVDVSPPSGFFCLGPGHTPVVAFGAGSGITPVFSVVKTALATTSRAVHLLYANRDRASIIFLREIEVLAGLHPDRLAVTHHLDVESGFVGAHDVRPLVIAAPDAEHFVCGPAAFMEVVEQALLESGVEPGRIHIERFTPAEAAPAPEPAEPGSTTTRVTIELDGRSATSEYRPGTTILQTARQMGLSPPFSCESGSCATCMARIVEGAASMLVNNALTSEEVEDGWLLTCQAVPAGPSVRVVYGYD